MSQPTQIMLFALLFTLSSWSADAADICLTREVSVSGNVVRLSDVITAENADLPASIANVELGLTPAEGKEKTISAQQVHECLLLSGFAAGEVRVMGSPVVIVTRGHGEARKNTVHKPMLGSADVVQASAAVAVDEEDKDGTVEEKIVALLRRQSASPVEWQVEIFATPRQHQWLAAAKEVRVSGGQTPYLGKQLFLVQGQVAGKPSQIQLQAKVSGTRTVLAFARTLPAGSIITAQDVVVRQLPHTVAPATYVTDAQEVVGQEVVRPISEGAPVSMEGVKEPRLIKRGSQVEVRSIASGVMIKMAAKAMMDGVKGEVVSVETLDTKEKIQARVTAANTVEIYALGITTGK